MLELESTQQSTVDNESNGYHNAMNTVVGWLVDGIGHYR
jgi:hypothetical protein